MSTASDLEWLMLDLINQERAKNNLDPLQLDLRLNASSEDHSSWMLNADVFSHSGAGGSSAGDRMRDAGFFFSGSWGWGENIAWRSERGEVGYADDVEALHVGLMNSSGHRANILNPNFEVVGIGIEVGTYKGWTAVMVTQNFAYTSSALQIDSPSNSAPVPAPPVLTVDTVVLEPGVWKRLPDIVETRDLDGDTPDRYQILDKSGLVEFSLNGKVLKEVNDRFTFPEHRLDDLMLRTEAQGVVEQLAFRARDEDGWGAWEQFNVMSTPGRDRPLLAVENMVFAENGEKTVALADHLTVLDRTNDKIVWYEIMDKFGIDNFVFDGGGAIQADKPYRVAPEDLQEIYLRGDDDVSVSKVFVRAFDGQDRSDWEVFWLRTVPDDDPLILA